MTMLRQMTLQDLPAVQVIEEMVQSTPWSSKNFADALAEGMFCYVAVDSKEQILGYSVLLPGVEELTILTLAAHPEYRRQGIATLLCKRAMQLAKRLAKSQLWLEVRVSNHAAIALYQKLGMVQVGRRAGYYQRPASTPEDALLFTLELQAL